jgi:hypothetical protein
MGWDGKPIPYWLYKLHGLGQVTSLVSAYLETFTSWYISGRQFKTIKHTFAAFASLSDKLNSFVVGSNIVLWGYSIKSCSQSC